MTNAIIFKPIYLEINQGHGNARRASLDNCSNNLVALMDSDDINLSNRFELQLNKFINDSELKLVGGQITEFIGNSSNIVAKRIVPETDKDIKKYMKKRCPMNQVSVMMKKDFYEEVGGYIDWYCEEDYYLWLRMALAGGKFANVPQTLVNVRIGDEMSSRRGGWKYFNSEKAFQKHMLKNKVISFPRYLYNVAIRFGGEILLSDKARTKAFKMIRKSPKGQGLEDNLKQDVIFTDEKKEFPPFSVAMCVYGGDNAEWFDLALESVVNQTVKPNEIVLVVDGPIPEQIQQVIEKYKKLCGGV